jgi:undecaprenyl-diphosphatase
MEHLHAVILGIIEGLTEFLPISSTGHLILAERMLRIDPSAVQWKVLLFVCQTGAIAAVVLYFWRDLWRRTFHPPTTAWQQHILTKLFAALVPTVVLGLLFNRHMEALEDGPYGPLATVGALIVGAFAMEYIDRRFRRSGPMELEHVRLAQAFLIGVIQCLAMWPGTSRSAATIMGGMALGLTPRVATEFSFYLAIPTLMLAGVKRAWDYRAAVTADQVALILLGTAVAFVVALVVVAAFMNYVRRYRFTPFAIYRVLLGVTVLVYLWRG